MNNKNKATYIVVSKPGMTPFAVETTKRAAAKARLLAKRLGLDGSIITR